MGHIDLEEGVKSWLDQACLISSAPPDLNLYLSFLSSGNGIWWQQLPVTAALRAEAVATASPNSVYWVNEQRFFFLEFHAEWLIGTGWNVAKDIR